MSKEAPPAASVEPRLNRDQRRHPDEWLTPVELSQEFKVPVDNLYQWRYKGVGPPAHKIGKHLRYRRSAVEKWLAAQLPEEARVG
jgi:predicted DNA-binding transcriptional regulator AlpA